MLYHAPLPLACTTSNPESNAGPSVHGENKHTTSEDVRKASQWEFSVLGTHWRGVLPEQALVLR